MINKPIPKPRFLISAVLGVIVLLVFSCQQNDVYQKPSIKAGYNSGTFFDIHLLIYPDSTFYYSNVEKECIGNWVALGDTLILKQKNAIQAILVDNKPTVINNPRYNWLRGMQFIENTLPSTVKFPSHN